MTKNLTPPTPNLTLQKFQEDVDDIGAFLETIEMTACRRHWQEELCVAYIRSSLSGAGMVEISSQSAVNQVDYQMLKHYLLATYQISNETCHRRVFV